MLAKHDRLHKHNRLETTSMVVDNPSKLVPSLLDPDSWSAVGTVLRQLMCTSGSLRNGAGPVLALFQGSL